VDKNLIPDYTLLSFLNFFKPKDKNSVLKKITENTYPWQKKNLISEKLCKQLKFHHQFHFTSLSSVSYELQNLFSAFCFVINYFFEKIFKTIAQKFAIQCK